MIQDIIAVAEKHWPEPVTVAMISKECGVSTWTISLQMKRLSRKRHSYPVAIELSREKHGRGIYKATYMPEVDGCRPTY